MLPAHLAENIRKQVLYYLQSTFTFRDPAVERAFEQFLTDPENGVFKGPWAQLKLPFRLAVEGEVIPFEFSPGFLPFKHQARSWRRLDSKGQKPKPTLVTTGTGSGKTECFLFPILDHCLRMKREKQKGIKAIILYPMNALASDQERRFAKVIHRTAELKNAGIRVGNYTGRYDPTEPGGGDDSGTVMMGADHGITNHNILQDNPPDILLTNYKMLDYLLMRPEDQKLWRHNEVSSAKFPVSSSDAKSGNWKLETGNPLRYLVLDELHTYDGAQGADVGCLLRRLKERLGIAKGDLCVVGTSATLDDRESLRDSMLASSADPAAAIAASADVKQTGSDRLANFASTLFEEDIDAEAVIGEMRMTVEEIISIDIEETQIPDPKDCEPLEDEDAALYAIRQSSLWGGPKYSGPTFSAHLFAKHERELTEQDQAIVNAIEQWSVDLGKWLKRQKLFQYLLETFQRADQKSNKPLTWLELVALLSSRDLGLKYYPKATERSHLCAAFFALVAQAKEVRSGIAFPIVPTQIQLWIRELRRLGRTVHQQPLFNWIDEPSQGFPSLPTFHCSDCGESGWVGLHDPEKDSEIGAAGVSGFQLNGDATKIYRAWFGYKGNRSPEVVVFSPQNPIAQTAATPPEILWDEQPPLDFGDELFDQPKLQIEENEPGEIAKQQEFGFKQWFVCPKSLVLRMDDGPCPLTHDPARFPVRINRDTLTHETKGVVGNQGCPNCGSKEGVLFIGSQSATLSSVAIDELFGSTLNNDPKLLAFTDSVQDASHRAGFFSARTYNFTFRTALQHLIDESGPSGVPLTEVGPRLLGLWSKPRAGWPGHIREAMASLIPPDLHDYAEFLEFRNSTTADQPSFYLRSDIERRLTWQATSEFGVRLLRGRTLETNGSSCLAWDEERIEKTITRLHDELPGIDPTFTSLTSDQLRVWVLGFLHRARLIGALSHPYIDSLATSGFWGKYPFGKTIPGRETYPPGHPAYEPRLLVTKSKGRHECVLSTSRGSRVPWHLQWVRKSLKLKNADEVSLLDLISALLNAGTQSGLLSLMHQTTDLRMFAISAQAARLVSDGVQFVCSETGRPIVRPQSEARVWGGVPSLEYYAKSGTYQAKGFSPRQEYYQDRYRKSALRRVVASEHTGLLATADREALEKNFSYSLHTDDPNVLTCTSTLEMGIDIGDLSSTMLCSIPPSTASYLQRIGRAGRSTGTALIISVVNQRPHDLFFYGRPAEMLRGKVDPPGCWLDASAVLVRQYYAFCLDSATKTKRLKHLPKSAKDLVDDLAKPDAEFRSTFQWIGVNEVGLRGDFLARFAGRVEEDTRVRFLNDSRAELLLQRTEGAAGEYDKALRDLRNALKRLDAQLKSLDPEENDARLEIEQEQRILNGRLMSLRRTSALEILTDHGLLPNYAFPERGVRFYGAVFNKHQKNRSDQVTIELTRPASAALKELAPDNYFYTHSRRFNIQQITVGNQNEPLIQNWAICGKCGHMRPTEELNKPNALPACPQCGHDGDSMAAADRGQQRQFIEYSQSQAISYMEHYDSLSGDTSDERERVYYQTVRSFDLTVEAPSGAVGEAGLPFGIEYRGAMIMREVNVGYLGGQLIVPFGVEQMAPEEGFQVCLDCGVVVPSNGRIKDALHRRSCSRRRANEKRKQENKDLLPYNWASIYLHRELRSEAIRLLLPIASRQEIDTLSACIHLGLRLRFEGNPAHLIVSPQVMPDAYSSMNRYYVVLLDAVPGGTGYLKTLYQQKDQHGRDAEGIMEVLRLAKNALETCSCRRVTHSASNPDTDGCYRCIRTYHMQYSSQSISRERGIELLTRLIKAGEQRLPQKELAAIKANSLFESMLEKKFVESLKDFVNKSHGTWEETIVQGSQGFRFTLPGAEYYWELQLQPQLGNAQGVSIACQPDFILRCDNSKVKPIAIFTDGFEFHCHPVNRLADDFQKRRAILKSGSYHVWNITWKDLDPAGAEQNMVCHQPVADRHKQFASAAAGQGKVVPDPLRIVRNGFEQLTAFIKTAHAPGWSQLATSANAYYLQQIASKRTVKATELKAAIESWHQTGSLSTLNHVEGGQWVHNEKASLTADLINYIKVDDAMTNRSHQSIMVARLGDSAAEVGSENFEERWRRFLACINLYQFLTNFHFATGSEIANGLVEEMPFEASAGLPKEWAAVRDNVCSGLRHCTEELAASGLSEALIPQIEYYNENIDDDAFAEMAWPNCNPPVAVLAGDQESFLKRWQENGWKVFTPDQLQAQGVAALIEHLHPATFVFDSKDWTIKNARRVTLIAKKADNSLTDSEHRELLSLQEILESNLAEWDTRLLREVSKIEERVKRSSNE